MNLVDRKNLLRENGLCYKCCDNKHRSSDCREVLNCQECHGNKHVTLMHGDVPKRYDGGEHPTRQNEDSTPAVLPVVDATCTEICKNSFQGESCAKILPVFVFPEGQREKQTKMYAMFDDQSFVFVFIFDKV
jgi:hypothetical protein